MDVQVPRRLEEASGGGSADRSRRARAQPARRRSRHPARQPRRLHRPVGSGKSSLAFDTIFAEGQRRYVESLSAYARQFLGQMDKPDVDFIEGLSPAVSIDQKSTNRNPRSTVGTITEVYDYLRPALRPRRGAALPGVRARDREQTPQQIVDQVLAMEEGARFQVLAPIVRTRKGEFVDLFANLQGQGYSRVLVDGTVHQLTDPPSSRSRRSTTSPWWSTGSR
jgi:excinuclease ABC subunit A